jgi:hypothetical protein
METRKQLRERISELEGQNEELLDVIESIGQLAQEAVEEEPEVDEDTDNGED